MKPERATAVAQEALIWLAGRPDALEGFLAASGATTEDLRAGADDPEFLGFVLDHVLQFEELVVAFARDAGVAPDLPARARATLPGGYVPNWT